MKNVIKPSEAVYVDEEISIGPRGSSHTQSLDGDIDVAHDQNYEGEEGSQFADNQPRKPNDDISIPQGLTEDVNDLVTTHASVNSPSDDDDSHSVLDSEDRNSDRSLEFMKDDEYVEENPQVNHIPNNVSEDNSDSVSSSDSDGALSSTGQATVRENPVDTDNQKEIKSQRINNQVPSGSSVSQSHSAISSSNANQYSVSSSSAPLHNQSAEENVLLALQHKIGDIHSMLSSLHNTLPHRSDSNIDSEWLTKLSSIEKLLESSHAAKNTGYDEGYTAGYQEAMKKGSDDIKGVIHKIRKISGELLSRRHELINESQDTIVDIILLIAKKVVKQISQDTKDIVVSNVKDALSKVKKHSRITIRINPTDLAANEKVLKTISHEISNDSEIEFVEDTTIDNGGVCIETESSTVNAQISAQLLEIENSIRDIR